MTVIASVVINAEVHCTAIVRDGQRVRGPIESALKLRPHRVIVKETQNWLAFHGRYALELDIVCGVYEQGFATGLRMRPYN